MVSPVMIQTTSRRSGVLFSFPLPPFAHAAFPRHEAPAAGAKTGSGIGRNGGIYTSSAVQRQDLRGGHISRTLSSFSIRIFSPFSSTTTRTRSTSSSTLCAIDKRPFTSSSLSPKSTKSKTRSDPFARRPTAKCDPYGQGGEPLTLKEAQALLLTVDPAWRLVGNDDSTLGGNTSQDDNDNDAGDDDAAVDSAAINPFALSRDFYHDDYIKGGQFVTQVVAAVAEMNNHYPHRCTLRRELVKKNKKQGIGAQWQVVTTVTCRTAVLRGLSHHDFFLATLIDVELDRPNIRDLVAVTQ